MARFSSISWSWRTSSRRFWAWRWTIVWLSKKRSAPARRCWICCQRSDQIRSTVVSGSRFGGSGGRMMSRWSGLVLKRTCRSGGSSVGSGSWVKSALLAARARVSARSWLLGSSPASRVRGASSSSLSSLGAGRLGACIIAALRSSSVVLVNSMAAIAERRTKLYPTIGERYGFG